jgi:hypothetical protein
MVDPMLDPTADPTSSSIRAQNLFVCRGVEATPSGGVVLTDVLEVVPVAEFPADAGPLHFVAFLRGLRAGTVEVTFRIVPEGAPDAVVASIPMRVTVPQGVEDRQVAIHGGLQKATVSRGGWYRVDLLDGPLVVATNRFAIGARSKA